MIVSFFVVAGAALCAPAQTLNSWINSGSGNWDDTSAWSLGALPDSSQSVLITNSGWKAVAIDSSTPVNFPDSMIVSNLFVSAPTNALSTVLLNYAGLGTPLKVLNNCVIGTNGAINNFSSSFEVDGNAGGQLLINGGTFTQVGGQTVVNAPVSVSSGGSLNATNGNLTLGNLTLGTTNSRGSFTQDGGSIAVQQLDTRNGGYTLVSGVLYAIGGTVGGILQWGGTNYGDITGGGTIDGGLSQGNLLTISGSFFQGGGLVDMQTVDWTGNNGNVLSEGTFRSGSINIHSSALVFMGQGGLTAGTVETGSLSISNSAHVQVTAYNLFVTNSLDIRGDSSNNPALLLVEGTTGPGTALNVGTITMGDNSVIDHYANAATELSSGLSMAGGQYSLQGGFLEGPYVGVGVSGTFSQSGGTNLVHGVLSITGTYDLAGTLRVDGIYLRGSLLLEAGTFANTGLIDLGGRIGIGVQDGSGGQVRLSANAAIGFIGTTTPRQLHFASSSAQAWTPGAVLVITNWNNSGSTHLFFGTNASSLTASQLGQITFLNPGGYSPGSYSAQLLSTAELVPASAAQPTLQSARYGAGLVLSWPSGYQLLSATNITGPYSPVNGATSPWTNSFSKPREFFRLQGL